MADARDRRLGAELRRIREEIGISAQSVADEFGWSQPKVTRIETGVHAIAPGDLLKLLTYYGAREEVTAELISMVSGDRMADGAWIVRAGGPPRRQGEVAATEGRVRRIRHYQMHYLPGQLQAPGLARALAAAGRFGDPDEIVRRRAARQVILAEPSSPAYEAVLDARVFLAWPSRDLIDEQTRFLRRRMDLAAVSVRIIPLDAGLDAFCTVPFVIYDFRQPESAVVFIESQTADVYLSHDADVQAYTQTFARLSENSLDREESRKYLEVLTRQAKRLSDKR